MRHKRVAEKSLGISLGQLAALAERISKKIAAAARESGDSLQAKYSWRLSPAFQVREQEGTAERLVVDFRDRCGRLEADATPEGCDIYVDLVPQDHPDSELARELWGLLSEELGERPGCEDLLPDKVLKPSNRKKWGIVAEIITSRDDLRTLSAPELSNWFEQVNQKPKYDHLDTSPATLRKIRKAIDMGCFD